MMRGFRRRLIGLVAVWLVCQLGVLSVVPVLLATGFTASGEAVLCTCAALGPGHFCPMHDMQRHHSDGDTDAGQESPDCTLSSGVPVSTITLSSLLNGVGLVPIAQSPQTKLARAETLASQSDVPLSRPSLPDSPPPRA